MGLSILWCNFRFSMNIYIFTKNKVNNVASAILN